MIDPGERVVERTFEHLAARDWSSFGALLSADVERIGPFGERVIGREAYVKLMRGDEQPRPPGDGHLTTWDVHRVVYAPDRRSAFARITAHVPQTDRELLIEQTLAYELDENGRISRIEVFWRDPRSRSKELRER